MRPILIADDNEIFRQVIEAALRIKGYLTVCANDGREALALLEQHDPILLLLDLTMPVLGGMAVLQAVRSDPARRQMPVVLMTAMSPRDCPVHDPQFTPDAYLVKSHFSLAQVVKTVHSLIGPC